VRVSIAHTERAFVEVDVDGGVHVQVHIKVNVYV